MRPKILVARYFWFGWMKKKMFVHINGYLKQVFAPATIQFKPLLEIGAPQVNLKDLEEKLITLKKSVNIVAWRF